MISPFLDWNKYELFNGYGHGGVFEMYWYCSFRALKDKRTPAAFQKKHF